VNRRLQGALTGAAVGAVPALGFALWASRGNPWFLDAPLSFTAFGVLPLALAGAAAGALVGRGNKALALLLMCLEVAALFACAAAPKPPPVDARLLVFGIDGASWELVDRLELPALERLEARGTRAILRSREPMFSPLLWTTMASGVVPEVHGIHGFKVSADHCRSARFFDVAWAQGLSIGIYKWLVTWPPAPTNPARAPEQQGFVVPAWLAPDAETWPASLSFVKEIELSRRLKRKKVSAVRPAWQLALAGIPQGFRWSTLVSAVEWSLRERFLRPTTEERAWRLQLLRVWMDRDVFIRTMHRTRPELLTFTTYATDALGHTHWGFMEQPGADPGLADAVPAAYRQADAVLGEVLANISDETAVLVVSDHGFRAMAAGDAGRYFAPRTERLQARIAAEVGANQVSKLGHKLTVSFSGSDWTQDRARFLEWLPTLTQQSTGQPFYRADDIPDSPSSVGLTLQDERIDAARLASDQVGGEPIADYATLTEAYTGEHDSAGIIVAAGPGIAAGARGQEASLLDVAPTSLALLGLAAAQDMPGSVVFGAGDVDGVPFERRFPRVATWSALAPGRGDAPAEAEVNEEQLKALGYIE
jgi:Type I phosphodiesterase / nucleotide pyrophosphatase